MKTASAKQKGRKLQQWVAASILALFPALSVRDVKSTSMGVTGSDVQLSQDAFKLFSYATECKSRKAISVYEWYQQAAMNDGEPLLIIKADRQKPLAVIDAEHFFKLVGGKRG